MNSLVLGIDHLGYAVRSTDESLAKFRVAYPQVDLYRRLDPAQNVYITYLSSPLGVPRVELVEPAGAPNPVEGILGKKKAELYHVCYRVRDFEAAYRWFKTNGYFPLLAPFQVLDSESQWACHFFHPASGAVEIVGPKGGAS